MRFKLLVMAALAMLLGDAALAQGRRPQEPQNSVAPLRVGERAPVTTSAIPPALTPDNTWVLDLSNGGRVQVQLRPDMAPRHVERIVTLTRQGFYNGVAFHRVIEGFMAQGGDPQGTGAGGSSLPDLAAEFNAMPHLRGAVSMARTQDPNSANSQFFIMFVPRLSMDGDYTVFGRVVSGMNFVDQITRGEPPANPTRIVRASIGSDNVPPPTPEEIAAVANRPAAGATPIQPLDVPSLTGLTPAPAQTPPAQTPPAQPAPAQTPPAQTPQPQPAQPAPQF